MSEQIRNVAIIAHVDHGKTTLVDQLLTQSGLFREGEVHDDLIMDSNPIERERGITILAKNCALRYADAQGNSFRINIVDTPGHSDFGGEVERVLKLADGVLLLVDAYEGPMPQTRYVLSKALANHLRPIIVLNKMDRPEARPQAVLNAIWDLFIDLGADDSALESPILYGSGRDGWMTRDMQAALDATPEAKAEGVKCVFETIIEHVPVPNFDPLAPLQMLITTLDYSEYVGRIGIGRVFAGSIRAGQPVIVIDRDGKQTRQRVVKLMQFEGLGRRETDEVHAGDLCAVVGLDPVDIGNTIACAITPNALPTVTIDEPTVDMTFRVNDSPFVGREGDYVTSRQLRQRLDRELQTNVALRVKLAGDEFKVSGRGLLHLGILLENMRREGYELTVGKPHVITHVENGKTMEPIEQLVVEVPSEQVGGVMQLTGDRRAELQRMEDRGGTTTMEFKIPARGLFGLRSRMLTATQGEAIMYHSFLEFAESKGDVGGRTNGVMIASESGSVTGHALEGLADRGVMFVRPGDEVYEGQIVGEHNRDNDLPVNVCRAKQLNNIRSSTKEATTTLKAPRTLTLEAALEYIEEDEVVEITPLTVRLRKRLLKESDRRREQRRGN